MKKRRLFIITTSIILVVLSGVILLLFTVGLPAQLVYYPDEGINGQVSASPNGSKIIYTYFNNGQADIYIVDNDGGDAKNITSTINSNEINPVFSPDGKRILYLKSSYTSTLKQSLWIMDIDGNNNKRLTSNDELVTEAIFSPVEDKIYFLKGKEFYAETLAEEEVPRKLDLYEVNINGSGLNKITNFEADILSNLSIDNLGKNLAFVLAFFTDREDFKEQVNKIKGNAVGFDLVLFNTKTNSINAINPKDKDTFYPAISPDGKNIVFMSDIENQKNGPYYFELYRMNIENLKFQRITHIKSYIKELIITNQGEILFLYDKNYPDGEEQLVLGKVDTSGKFKKIPLNH